jgi:hypothetical protein
VLALLPELTLLLSTPIVVAGFNTLFGISIAIPIIQSIQRHLDAFGSEERVRGYSSHEEALELAAIAELDKFSAT